MNAQNVMARLIDMGIPIENIDIEYPLPSSEGELTVTVDTPSLFNRVSKLAEDFEYDTKGYGHLYVDYVKTPQTIACMIDALLKQGVHIGEDQLIVENGSPTVVLTKEQYKNTMIHIVLSWYEVKIRVTRTPNFLRNIITWIKGDK